MPIDTRTDARISALETTVNKGVIDITADYFIDTNIVLTSNGNYQQFTIAETELNGITLNPINSGKFLFSLQTNLEENGIYVVIGLNPTLITRASDFRSYEQIQGITVDSVVRIQIIKEGLPNYQGNFYTSSTTKPFILGATPITITPTTPKTPLPTTLEELTDVSISNKREGAILQYNYIDGKWQDTLELTTDGTFASPSDSTVPTSQAIITKLNNLVIDGGVF